MKAFLKLWFKNLREGIPLGLFISLMWLMYLGPIVLLVCLTDFKWHGGFYMVIAILWVITAGSLVAATIHSKWK